MDKVGVLLAVALVWLLLNLKAGQNWLKVVSITGLLIFLGLACAVALDYAGIPAP